VQQTIRIALAAPNRVPHIVDDLPELAWVQGTWAGVETMCLGTIGDQIVVSRAAGVFGPAMREFVLGHLLAHKLRVVARATSTSWDPSPPGLLMGDRLAIAGTGEIGREVGAAALGLGLELRGLNRSGAIVSPFTDVTTAPVDLAAGSDHLVCILPETEATRGIIGADVLDALNPGATFINVGRGSAVAPSTVVDALGSGRLSLAVLDVVENEPLEEDDPLWHVPGLVLTSHTAAWSRPEDIVRLFIANLRRWRRGETLIGLVDRRSGY
jgi:phosphoglycerate dehydrogenase-like enzyme